MGAHSRPRGPSPARRARAAAGVAAGVAASALVPAVVATPAVAMALPAGPVAGSATLVPAASSAAVLTGPGAPGLAAELSLDLAALRGCESSGDYAADTGNGYFGAYQFDLPTWESLGYRGLPSAAPPAVQDAAAVHLEAERGWEPWPACSRRLGLRPLAPATPAGGVEGPPVVTAAASWALPGRAVRVPAFRGTVLTTALEGQRRADVAVWQARMARRGWTITVDGFFGPQSAAVARAFTEQKQVPTAFPGQVDAAVWRAAWTAPVTPG